MPVPNAEGYEVHQLLGRGSSGTVWRATQAGTLREVAVKFLAPWHLHGLASVRFAREAEIAASLEHENIARVFEGGEENGSQWLAMELVDGPPVDRWVAENNPGLRERIALFRNICAAVRHAHQRGVIHRDLKPANVLVAAGEIPKVVDFGLACWQEGPSLDVTLTRQGEVFGSLAWMPPEQAAGRWAEVDALSDIFALGAILYSLIAGGPPLDPALPPAALLAAAQSGERKSLRLVRPGTPRDLEAIVEKCLAPEKSRRYQSAAGLEADVGRWLAGEPVRAKTAAPLYWMGKKIRRHWVAAAGGAAILTTFTGLTWAYLHGQRNLERERQRALERETAQAARTLHEAQELVTQLMLEMRPKLEAAGHPEWIEEAAKKVAAFDWNLGGSGGAYDSRRFRARMALVSAEVLAAKAQWGNALKAWQQAAALLEPLVKENPGAPVFREELGSARIGEEMALLKLGFHRDAVSAGQKALAALTPPEGGPVTPSILETMVEATCMLVDAAFLTKGKTDNALEVVAGLVKLLPPAARPGDMTGEQAMWHSRIGREQARLTAILKSAQEADPIASRAIDCARQAHQLTGQGEMAARVLAQALATGADIARVLGDAARTFTLLTGATGALGGKKAKLPASMAEEPLLDVVQAWIRYTAWMEQTNHPEKVIEGNGFAIDLLGKSGRRNPSDVTAAREQASLMLQNARLSRQLHQTPDAVRWATASISRFRKVMEKSPGKVDSYLNFAEAAIFLAEMNAPAGDSSEPWPAAAARALEVPRSKAAAMNPPEREILTLLEQRLNALNHPPEPSP